MNLVEIIFYIIAYFVIGFLCLCLYIEQGEKLFSALAWFLIWPIMIVGYGTFVVFLTFYYGSKNVVTFVKNKR